MVGKYQAYSEYKDSGIDGVSRLPVHWAEVPLKHVSTCNNDVLPESTDPDFEFDYIDISSVSKTEGITKTERMKFGASPSRARRLVKNGDVVVSTVRTYLEAIAPILRQHEGMVASTGFAVIRPTRLDSAFARYALRAQHFIDEVVARSTGVSYPAINASDLVRISILVPPIQEQRTIAAYLDRETAHIDRLIEKQQRLIELLKEKRQALISHAVTKGLDPGVPMNDSGVAWLGKVPAHWKVAPVGYRYHIQLGKMLDSSKIAGSDLRPYIRVFDVQWGSINIKDLPQMDFNKKDRIKFRLRRGDLLVNEGGSYVGRSAIWAGELEECYYQKALHRLRPIDGDSDTTDFFYYVMSFATTLGVFVAGGNQATIEHLTAESLRRYRFAFPPLEEQKAIAEFLNQGNVKIDSLISKANHAVNLLAERRTALISAAVTGKIDVRNWQPSTSTQVAESDLSMVAEPTAEYRI